MNASVLLVLALIVPAALALWLFKHLRRTTAVLFAVAAALLVVGYSTWRDSLASLVTTEDSLAALIAVAGLSGLIFGIHIHSARKQAKDGKPHKDHHHHIWTPAIALVGGTSVALAVCDGLVLLRQLAHAPAGTSSAFAQAVAQVNSGQAGHAVSHSQGETVAAIGLGVLVALIFLARWHSGEGKKKTKPGKPQAAIPAGSSPGSSPARRSA